MSPIGFSVTYGINTIPVCLIDLDPTDSSILTNSDSLKRQAVNLTCTVQSDTGLPTATTRTLTFSGLYDGLSPSQSVGSASYNAVVKGNAQILLETYSKIPGFCNMGTNPYQIVNNFLSDLNGDGAQNFGGLEQATLQMLTTDSINALQYYYNCVLAILTVQKSGFYDNLISSDALNNGFTKLLQGTNYLANVSKALDIMTSNFDTSAITDVQADLGSTFKSLGTGVLDMYMQGPDRLWENLLNFYGSCGCNLVPANNKIFVVPDNGFVYFDHSSYSSGKSGQINAAFPADYSSYSYNDNGYVSIGAVGIVANNQISFNGFAFNPLFLRGSFIGPDSLPGSAIVELPDHIFAMVDSNSALEVDNYLPRLKLYTPDIPGLYTKKVTYAAAASTPAQTSQSQPTIKDLADNYAEIKYYQLRYGDRIGQIVMNFNPNWVPGTCGTLYIKIQGGNVPDGTYIDFLVQSVTHRVSVSAPTTGTSMTVVTFSCGRVGTSPVGVTSDAFFQYDSGKMATVQSNFLSDIGAS